ncbi:hypothetical protein Phum_PHUM491040 [Pediculus humanus corporis]|uniref:Brinker DNA-binding domain-containing protein n=1 Tax=Pediculus humanus subsp. corporis TaxID=121224 RepID=E0VWU0_PEDHC|nr:uncharacterized protein Phum_PHUM491040 [Pediculus humanus corporis]EEB17846.1 hypothetical protein Phum_PHUM491040 [Pediculus humanus corporis]
MAQGLDVRSLSSAKSPPIDSKTGGESIKRTRGVGSRRIFSPHFKLQVLDSYRYDADCRGNQRATARKYNIHRRQIQKWLQCEQSLRTSVEKSVKNENSNFVPLKPSSKKILIDDVKTESSSSSSITSKQQTAIQFSRLGRNAGDDDKLMADEKIHAKTKYKNDNNNIYNGVEDSKIQVQNLKRVAQKLYPSLQNVSCLTEDKLTTTTTNSGRILDSEKKYFHTDEIPRSDILPEEFPARKIHHEDGLPEDKTHKLKIKDVVDNCQSGLTWTTSENICGPKLLCSSNASVLKCPVQKNNMGDTGVQEMCVLDTNKNVLLCSQSFFNKPESNCLPDVSISKIESSSNDVRSKILNSYDCTKSFSPKRKWIKESMQDMLEEDSEPPQENPSSLPIKQRVKMNLRSIPESFHQKPDEDAIKSSRGSSFSNFTIEKICSKETTKETSRRPSIISSCHGDFSQPFNYSCRLPPPLTTSLSTCVSPDDEMPPYGDVERTLMTSYDSYNYPLDVSLKEEKISDGEDVDVDVLSTTPVEKKSFDFTNYNFGKRRSFSVQFKLTVLDAFYNDKDCNKNQRATARKFNINRRQVQKWLSQENDLRSESSLKNGKYLQRQRLASGDNRDASDVSCTRCPQHCFLGRNDDLMSFDDTIQVNVKHCSDDECFARRMGRRSRSMMRDKLDAAGGENHGKTANLTGGVEYYNKNALFPGDLKTTTYYQNYFYPENNGGMIYHHDAIFGWPHHLNSSALGVPNFQSCLSTWHHNIDYCHDNPPKIY